MGASVSERMDVSNQGAWRREEQRGSRVGNLPRVLAGVEYEHGMQRGVELLSAGEMVLWSGACLLANGKERRWLGHFKGATPVHGAPGPWRGRRACGSSSLGELGGGATCLSRGVEFWREVGVGGVNGGRARSRPVARASCSAELPRRCLVACVQ
jgi:hypothetical protein